jgi:hypothetical protein
LSLAADVLDYGMRIDEIKRLVRERQRSAVSLNQCQIRKLIAQFRQVFDAQPVDAFRVRIAFLEVIGRPMVIGR